jgi:hypothetical protein
MSITHKQAAALVMMILLLILPGCLGSPPAPVNPTQAPTLQPATTSTDPPTPLPAVASTPALPVNTPGVAQAAIDNAWTGYNTSGFRFDNGSVVSWASRQADILASSRDQSGKTIWFFIPNDSPPYQSRYDKGAKAGIITIPQTTLDPAAQCPQDGYEFHWVEAKIGVVYCVRTRDGKHHALVQVVQNQDNLVFDWVYLPGESEAAQDGAAQPPQPVTYTSIDQDYLTLYPVIGRNVVLLVPSPELDAAVLRQMVETIDRAYDFYRDATGREPQLYLNYHEMPSIAVVPTACGAGCGYLGMSGIELQSDYFDKLYRGVLENNQYDQPVFYELGRNFWFYENKIEYIGEDRTDSISTGYAVFMRFMAMEAAGVTPAPYNGTDFSLFKEEVENLYPGYLLDKSLNWDNTLRIGKAPTNALDLGGADLFAAFLFDLRSRYGNDFVQWIWKEVDLRPDAVTTQDAVDNFVLAASAAVEQNLTRLFVERYRWPVSSSAKKEALTRFGEAVRP